MAAIIVTELSFAGFFIGESGVMTKGEDVNPFYLLAGLISLGIGSGAAYSMSKGAFK